MMYIIHTLMHAGKGGLGGKGEACSFSPGFYLNLYNYIRIYLLIILFIIKLNQQSNL